MRAARSDRHPRALDPVSWASRRNGFTLVELIVAVLLLTVGLGALAGTSTWVLRETAASRRAERAAVIAQARLELLRVGSCASGSGTATHGELVERWSVVLDERRAIAIVSVAGRDHEYLREQRYQAAFRC